MNAKEFRTMFMVLHHMDLDTLERGGVITKGAKGGSDWTRFNNDLTTFASAGFPDQRIHLLEFRAGRDHMCERLCDWCRPVRKAEDR